MDQEKINHYLSLGKTDIPGMFPHLDQMVSMPFVFKMDFGLSELPLEPGVLMIRGPRQYGKSTWLEGALKQSVERFGPGTAFYLNGDFLLTSDQLEAAITNLLPIYHEDAKIKRLFIDEITAIPAWEMAIKRLSDQGKLRDILIVTTGSNASDLRRGSERLPGRKGKLDRSHYWFTPMSYGEFHRVCSSQLGVKTWIAYLLSGGSPLAASELASTGVIREYVLQMTRDWVEGELVKTGRSRISLNNILTTLFRFAGNPVGQAKLARESALSNNTIAANYVELLNDLGIISPCYPWDPQRNLVILRKPCKFHFTNLLVAVAYHPKQIRSIAEFERLTPEEQGAWIEWLVAQELLRQNALVGEDILMPQKFYQDASSEIDFVRDETHYLEVKRGQSSAFEYAWFMQKFPKCSLEIINKQRFSNGAIQGILLEDFLMRS